MISTHSGEGDIRQPRGYTPIRVVKWMVGHEGEAASFASRLDTKELDCVWLRQARLTVSVSFPVAKRCGQDCFQRCNWVQSVGAECAENVCRMEMR